MNDYQCQELVKAMVGAAEMSGVNQCAVVERLEGIVYALEKMIPPRAELVRLETATGTTTLFSPRSVAALVPSGEDCAYVLLHGETEEGGYRVKGTPAEVAERLGMVVR